MNSKKLLYFDEVDFLGWCNYNIYFESSRVEVLDQITNIKDDTQAFRVSIDLVQDIRMWP